MFALVIILLSIGSATYAKTGGQTVVGDSPQARELYHLADNDTNGVLTHAELSQVFFDFDLNHDGGVTSTEFVTDWLNLALGPVQQAVTLFLNLDVNNDDVIDQAIDMPYIFIFFDRNADAVISEGEFIIQWVKIST